MAPALRPPRALKGESPLAFARFMAYCRMPATHRSVASLARAEGISRQALGRMCSRWQWVRRVQEWEHRALADPIAAARADLFGLRW